MFLKHVYLVCHGVVILLIGRHRPTPFSPRLFHSLNIFRSAVYLVSEVIFPSEDLRPVYRKYFSF